MAEILIPTIYILCNVTVTNSIGNPVSGASVHAIYTKPDTSIQYESLIGLTSTAGEIVNFQLGITTQSPDTLYFTATKDGVTRVSSIITSPGSSVSATITMPSELEPDSPILPAIDIISITITVEDQFGNAVSGATVSIPDFFYTGITSSAGTIGYRYFYQVDEVVPLRVQISVSVSKTGYTGNTQTLLILNNQVTGTITITAPEPTLVVNNVTVPTYWAEFNVGANWYISGPALNSEEYAIQGAKLNFGGVAPAILGNGYATILIPRHTIPDAQHSVYHLGIDNSTHTALLTDSYFNSQCNAMENGEHTSSVKYYLTRSIINVYTTENWKIPTYAETAQYFSSMLGNQWNYADIMDWYSPDFEPQEALNSLETEHFLSLTSRDAGDFTDAEDTKYDFDDVMPSSTSTSLLPIGPRLALWDMAFTDSYTYFLPGFYKFVVTNNGDIDQYVDFNWTGNSIELRPITPYGRGFFEIMTSMLHYSYCWSQIMNGEGSNYKTYVAPGESNTYYIPMLRPVQITQYQEGTYEVKNSVHLQDGNLIQIFIRTGPTYNNFPSNVPKIIAYDENNKRFNRYETQSTWSSQSPEAVDVGRIVRDFNLPTYFADTTAEANNYISMVIAYSENSQYYGFNYNNNTDAFIIDLGNFTTGTSRYNHTYVIRTEPEDATIKICSNSAYSAVIATGTGPEFTYNYSTLTASQTVYVQISRTGYSTHQQSVTCSANSTAQFSVSLSRVSAPAIFNTSIDAYLDNTAQTCNVTRYFYQYTTDTVIGDIYSTNMLLDGTGTAYYEIIRHDLDVMPTQAYFFNNYYGFRTNIDGMSNNFGNKTQVLLTVGLNSSAGAHPFSTSVWITKSQTNTYQQTYNGQPFNIIVRWAVDTNHITFSMYGAGFCNMLADTSANPTTRFYMEFNFNAS